MHQDIHHLAAALDREALRRIMGQDPDAERREEAERAITRLDRERHAAAIRVGRAQVAGLASGVARRAANHGA